MISRKSLDTLLYIAHHPVFKMSLKVIMFGTEHSPRESHIRLAITRSSNWLNVKAKVERATDDIDALIRDGEDIDMIARAIRMLENLQEIGVLASSNMTSYGYEHWTEESGFHPIIPPTTAESKEASMIRRLVWTVLRAVDLSRCDRPLGLAFDIARGEHDDWYFLPPTAFEQFDTSQVPHTCANANALTLRFDCELTQPHRGSFMSLRGLETFLMSFKGLQHLRLIQFTRDGNRRRGRQLMQSLNFGDQPLFADDFRLDFLISISLQGVQFKASNLIHFLRRSQSTLKNISLIGCLCEDPTWGVILTMIREELNLSNLELCGNAVRLPSNLLVFLKASTPLPNEYTAVLGDFSSAEHHDQATMRVFVGDLISRMCLLDSYPKVWADRGIMTMDFLLDLFDMWKQDGINRAKKTAEPVDVVVNPTNLGESTSTDQT
jgi:hypothetical protein